MLFLYSAENKKLVYSDPVANDCFVISRNHSLPSWITEKLKHASAPLKVTPAQLGLKSSGSYADLSLPASFEVRLIKTPDTKLIEVSASDRNVVSEKSLATIIDSAVDGIVIIDQNGIILGFNRSAEKMFGINATDAIGKNVTVLMPEPHRSKHDAYIKRYLKTQIPHIVGIGRKVDALKASGEVFPIDLAVGEVRLATGRLFTGFIRDLSESQRLESERDNFFEMSLDLFCIMDFKGIIKKANPIWQDLLGYTPYAVQRRSLIDFVLPAEGQSPEELLNEILNSTTLVGKRFRIKTATGEYRWILWNSRVDDRNRVIYGVARDITEQQRIIEKLEQAKLEAERLSDARGMFIARMSHELRTPLNSIIGFSGILHKNASGRFSKKDLVYLDRISKNGFALLKLINAVLEFSKTEAGFQQTFIEKVNLVELIEEIVDLMKATLSKNNVEITLDIPARECFIETDQVKLRQIIQNILDNAVKFSEQSRVKIALSISDKTKEPLALEITDSGPGISDDDLNRIFEAFLQCEDTVTRRYGGAGLGLAIAKSFADLLGFKIEVDSRLGAGSCFRILFDADMKVKERHAK